MNMADDTFVRRHRFGDIFDSAKSLPRVKDVLTIDNVTKSDFHKLARCSQPFIFKNPSPIPPNPIKTLQEYFPEEKIKVRVGDYVSPESYLPENRKTKESGLAVYIDELLADGKASTITPPYAGNFSLPQDFLSKIGASFPAWHCSKHFEPPTVWLGPQGSITPLHRDSTDNFIYQLVGCKAWTIFSPVDAPYLYMTTNSASVGGDFAPSAVDLRAPDLNLFPKFAQATPINFVLNAGECLYLPAGWGHFVKNLSVSLMVNYWLSLEPIPPGILG